MITGGHGATTPGLTRALEGLPLSLLMNAIAAERLPADPRWSHGRLRYRAARGLIPSTRDAGRLWFSLGDVHTIAATTPWATTSTCTYPLGEHG